LDCSWISALNWARSVAALLVLFHHVAQYHHWSPWIRILTFGQEAVMLFFIVSGFTIFASETKREWNTLYYYIRRIRRIYPCLLAALLLSTVVALLNGDLLERFDGTALLGTLLGLADQKNKPGTLFPIYLSNMPLWSLSYEIFFYAVFPIVFVMWRRDRAIANHIIGLTCCTSYALYSYYPSHFLIVSAYFQVWWVGASCAFLVLSGERLTSALLAPVAWLTILMVLASLDLLLKGSSSFSEYPFVVFRHFLSSLLIVLAVLVFWQFVPVLFLRLSSATGAYIASLSYGIYVFHQPILSLKLEFGYLTLPTELTLIFVLSWFFDRFLNSWLPKPSN
jgi:peptidoglycan/LPS O-acetylase OafA/YrhL